jgi:hypothetical protein
VSGEKFVGQQAYSRNDGTDFPNAGFFTSGGNTAFCSPFAFPQRNFPSPIGVIGRGLEHEEN